MKDEKLTFVGQIEKKTQARVVALFLERLGYAYRLLKKLKEQHKIKQFGKKRHAVYTREA